MARKIEVTYQVPIEKFDRENYADTAQVEKHLLSYTVTQTFEHTGGALWADNDGAPCELEDIVTNPFFDTMVSDG